LGQKPRALLTRAKAVDHPSRHVVDGQIGGGRYTGRCKLFEDDRRIDPTECAAPKLLAHINAGKTECGGAAQCFYRELGVCVPACGVRRPLLTSKRPRCLLERPLLVRELKIHGTRYKC